MDVKLTLILNAFILIFGLTAGQFPNQPNPPNNNNNLLTNGQPFLGNNNAGGQFNGEPSFPVNNNFNGQTNPVNNNFNNGQANPINGQFPPRNNIPGQPGNQGINPNTLGINTPINNQVPGPGGFPPNNNNMGAFPGNNNPSGIASFQPGGFQTVNNQFQNPFVAGNNFGPGFGGPGFGGPGRLCLILYKLHERFEIIICFLQIFSLNF